MKTYLLNAVKRLKNYSQKLDANAVLYDKSWEVFNESGDKELMIFRTNKELLISRNGIVQKGTWELLDIANLIIDVGEKTYLFNTAYVEDEFLALKLDGTNEYMIMIETDMKNRFSLDSVKSIEGYLDNRYNKIKQFRIEEEAKLERKKREEQEKQKQLEILRITDIKQNAERRYKNAIIRKVSMIAFYVLFSLVFICTLFMYFRHVNYGYIKDVNNELRLLISGGLMILFFPLLVYNIINCNQAKKDYNKYLEIIEKEKINQENS